MPGMMIHLPRLCALALLLFVSFPLPAQRSTESSSAQLDVGQAAEAWLGRQAYGMYMMGKKVGFAVNETSRVERQGVPALQVDWKMQFEIKMFGEVAKSTNHSTEWYALQGEGQLLGARSIEVSDGVRTEHSLDRKDGEWILVGNTGKRRTERKPAAPKLSLSLYARFDQWLAAKPKPGAEFELWSLELSGREINKPQKVEFRKREDLMLAGVSTPSYLVDMSYSGLRAKVRVRNALAIFEVNAGQALRLVAQEERVAKRMDDQAQELSLRLSVPIKKDLGKDPGAVVELELAVKGLGDFDLPQSHRQRLERKEDGSMRLILRRDFRRDRADTLEAADIERYSSPEPGIESDDEKIVAAARKIAGKRKDPIDIARRLQLWIYRKLDKSSARNSDSARTIYDQLSGDCTEHSRLFVAFARALGIPAREVAGLLYYNEGQPAFAWHQWAEIHDGHQWVSVDPAWNQVYVDATHIYFATDIEDLGWVNVLGALEFRVLRHRIQK
jgi:hypothetical protein